MGKVILYLRKEMKLTQEQLAMGICSSKYIYLLEKDKYEPSYYILDGISKKLGINVQDFYKKCISLGSIEVYEAIHILECNIRNKDFSNAYKLALEYEKNQEFNRRMPFQYICYTKGVYENNVNGNNSNAIRFCEDALERGNKEWLSQIRNYLFDDIELRLLVMLEACLRQSSRYNEAEKIAINLINRFCDSVEKYKMTYEINYLYIQVLICSKETLAAIYVEARDYDKAEDLVEETIRESVETKYLDRLPALMELKYNILREKELFSEAKRIYNNVIFLCKLFSWHYDIGILEKNKL